MPRPAVIHCRSPLTKSGRCTQRVRVIDKSLSRDRNRFEAAMGVLGETGDPFAVIHAPAVLAAEIMTDGSPCKGVHGSHILIPRGIGVLVVSAEQERVQRLPSRPQRRYIDQPVVEGGSVL